MFVVMRYATFQEDGGEDCIVEQYDTLEEARKWIADQAGAYFPPSSYYIMGKEE